MEIIFEVKGRAFPAGSKKFVGFMRSRRPLLVDACKNTKQWQKKVAAAGLAAMKEAKMADLIKGPVSASFFFWVKRPKCHYTSGNPVKPIKINSPRKPITRPDLLKLARAIEDALTNVVYGDDSQIVEEYMEKNYTEGTERVYITIRTL